VSLSLSLSLSRICSLNFLARAHPRRARLRETSLTESGEESSFIERMQNPLLRSRAISKRSLVDRRFLIGGSSSLRAPSDRGRNPVDRSSSRGRTQAKGCQLLFAVHFAPFCCSSAAPFIIHRSSYCGARYNAQLQHDDGQNTPGRVVSHSVTALRRRYEWYRGRERARARARASASACERVGTPRVRSSKYKVNTSPAMGTFIVHSYVVLSALHYAIVFSTPPPPALLLIMRITIISLCACAGGRGEGGGGTGGERLCAVLIFIRSTREPSVKFAGSAPYVPSIPDRRRVSITIPRNPRATHHAYRRAKGASSRTVSPMLARARVFN